MNQDAGTAEADEHERLRRMNRNYPTKLVDHQLYQGVVAKWKPLIDAEDPAIYSDWTGFRWEEEDNNLNSDERVIEFVLQGKHHRQLKHLRGMSIREVSDVVFKDHASRRDIMKILLQRFIHVIEHTEDKGSLSGTNKRSILHLMNAMHSRGQNPFDYFYFKHKDHARASDTLPSKILLWAFVYIVLFFLVLKGVL